MLVVTMSKWRSMVLRYKLVYLLLFLERRNEVPQLLVCLWSVGFESLRDSPCKAVWAHGFKIFVEGLPPLIILQISVSASFGEIIKGKIRFI